MNRTARTTLPCATALAKLAEELTQHVKSRLAPYKYPRWIEFMDDLPKSGTGKIQRFKLGEIEQRSGAAKRTRASS
jgi:acyl-coenzyme A synthetase/AMP-(fatty) acid ligase